MTRGVRKYLVGSVVLVALIGVAGCSRYLFATREPWRRDAELACLNSGAVKDTPARVRVSSIDGPGICGISYPIKVSSLGDDAPLGYDDEPPRPPGAVPLGAMPQRWPGTQSSTQPSAQSSVQSSALPPPSSPQPYNPAPYSSPQYGAPPSRSTRYQAPSYNAPPPAVQKVGAPLSLLPPGVAPPDDNDEYAPTPSPYGVPPARPPVPDYMSRPQAPPPSEPIPPL